MADERENTHLFQIHSKELEYSDLILDHTVESIKLKQVNFFIKMAIFKSCLYCIKIKETKSSKSYFSVFYKIF